MRRNVLLSAVVVGLMATAAHAQQPQPTSDPSTKAAVAAMYNRDTVKPDAPFGDLPINLAEAADATKVTAAVTQLGEPQLAEMRGRCSVIQATPELFPEEALDICQIAIPDTESVQEEQERNAH